MPERSWEDRVGEGATRLEDGVRTMQTCNPVNQLEESYRRGVGGGLPLVSCAWASDRRPRQARESEE